ncbi:hypothetical protein ABMA70_03065 [Halobacteriovorax sp. XZX-3]
MIFNFFESFIELIKQFTPEFLHHDLLILLIINLFISIFVNYAIKLISKYSNKITDKKERDKNTLLIAYLLCCFIFSFLLLDTKKGIYTILIIYLALALLFIFIYIVSRQYEKWVIPTEFDGDLRLVKEPRFKDFSILACPNCKTRTISWIHAIKEPQTCGVCEKKYKGMVPVRLDRALLIVAFLLLGLGIYLFTVPCLSKVISALIMCSGFVAHMIYRIIPKGLDEVKDDSV